MALLDFLRPQQAQQPGAMQQQGGGILAQLLDPSVALPMAGALMGQSGNSQNFANAFTAAGPAMAQQQTRARGNKTAQWLRTQGQNYADMLDNGVEPTEVWQMYLGDRKAQTANKGQGFINAGGGNLFNSETGEWVSAPGGGSEGVAGLQPVWLQDEQGNPILGQMTKDGKVIRSEIGEGLTPVGPYQRSFETGRGGAEGKVVGEAAGALPGATQMAANISQQVDELKNDPYLPRMLGPVDSRLPNMSQDAARVQAKINQLQGGAFLQARQMLKGGGAITDYEGKKAEEAFARLAAAQSVGDFNQALDDFNTFVQMGLQKLQAQAGQHRMGGGMPGGPQGGPVDYKGKYGLD